MGKIRTRVIGMEEVEKEQKKKQKEKSEEKKLAKKNSTVEVQKKETAKDKENKKTEAKAESKDKDVKVKKITIRPRGKKYIEAKKKTPQETLSLEKAVESLKKIKYAGFNESVEVHINADKTGVKGEVEFPFSTGKTIRIAIVDDTVLNNLEKGLIDFDLLIAAPSYMPKLAKYAKILGPKGLMPNPKSGTISPKPEEVAKKFQKGTARWKTEPKFPLIHQMIAKVEQADKEIVQNAAIFLKAVGKNHIQQAFIKTTMSPSIKIDLSFLE